MAIPNHPLSAMKGTQAARDMMAQVSAHKTKGAPVAAKKKPVATDAEDAADVASEPTGEPVNEKVAAIQFMNKRRAAAKGA